MPHRPACRFCGSPLVHTFVDLGMSPLCESFLSEEQISGMEPFYPLKVYVCGECFLVQLEEFVSPEAIFREYAYFSSYSDSWLAHAKRYTDYMMDRFGLDSDSAVVELASNDGYLLQYFIERGVRSIGVEPAKNVAKAAEEKGVPTVTEFFGTDLARVMASEGQAADLIVGNNVLAQVPDLNDFVAGVAILLKPTGVLTMEFPHLMRLVEGNQFDTIYHEHFSYFSFATAERIFAKHGIVLFDVEELPTHGGSIRVFGRHERNDALAITPRVRQMRQREREQGFGELVTYTTFREQVENTKHELLQLLIDAKRAGNRIVGYGAPGKGNTLLNYCGVRTDFIEYTVDRNPYKHGRYTPGTHIPIHPPDRIRADRPDLVLVLPWNLREEIMTQLSYVLEWGGRFLVPIPKPTIVDGH